MNGVQNRWDYIDLSKYRGIAESIPGLLKSFKIPPLVTNLLRNDVNKNRSAAVEK